jgi:hypothetical protein
LELQDILGIPMRFPRRKIPASYRTWCKELRPDAPSLAADGDGELAEQRPLRPAMKPTDEWEWSTWEVMGFQLRFLLAKTTNTKFFK